MKNFINLETIRNILPSVSDEEDIIFYESDIDEEERISEKEDDSDSERVHQAIQKMKILMINLQMTEFLVLRKTETSSSHGNGRIIHSRKLNKPFAIYVIMFL
ncbi:hypothetical protein NPIL_189931 [Nephila pilipes]|uniref:Uncharacterized protein n=1 Tax=Nephila pilipes TaxID=299642 RepID=A0A8X6PSC6_NEPPI|nr:hypothetical protein NPIL_189931 [Nephila pilipes]